MSLISIEKAFDTYDVDRGNMSILGADMRFGLGK